MKNADAKQAHESDFWQWPFLMRMWLTSEALCAVLINNKPMDQADGLRTLPSNMTVEHGITQVIDGSLWGVSGAWALPMVTINTSRYTPHTHVHAARPVRIQELSCPTHVYRQLQACVILIQS